MKDINELKRLYNCADTDHKMWRRVYLETIEEAKDNFMSEMYERATELLKDATNYLELSANAREERDALEKELQRRHAIYLQEEK